MCSTWKRQGILGMATEIFFPQDIKANAQQNRPLLRGKKKEKKIEDAHALRAHLKIFHQASHQNIHPPPNVEHKPTI